MKKSSPFTPLPPRVMSSFGSGQNKSSRLTSSMHHIDAMIQGCAHLGEGVLEPKQEQGMMRKAYLAAGQFLRRRKCQRRHPRRAW